ncbi:MAG: hypothetical protein KGO96_10600 [Elusimicrobia bacterium]|nr:hypothetical protein [Elusimicrobiota bacterium]
MELREYPNLPRSIGIVVSSKYATLHELQTIYSVEDVQDLIEVITTDGQNQEIVRRHEESKNSR